MKVILLQKVAGLGNPDDIKDVAEGYAKNFLFPKHLAIQASTKAVNDLDAHHKKLARESERDLRDQQTLAQRVDGVEIELKEKASEKGLLYAAVTPAKVADRLAKLGFTLDKDQIIMKPIKEAGTYPVKVKFRHGLEAEVSIIVSC